MNFCRMPVSFRTVKLIMRSKYFLKKIHTSVPVVRLKKKKKKERKFSEKNDRENVFQLDFHLKASYTFLHRLLSKDLLQEEKNRAH